MTDKETIQMALDALLANTDASLGMTDKMYVASHAILALRKQLQQPESKPLMDYAIVQECRDIAAGTSSIKFSSLNWFTAGVVFSERVHGIKKTK